MSHPAYIEPSARFLAYAFVYALALLGPACFVVVCLVFLR